MIQDQAGRFTLELRGKRSSRTHLNTLSPVIGYHLKACPKSVDHYKLAGVAEVDRADEVFGHAHQAHEAFDQVVHIAKRAGLHAVAVEGDGLALQRLDDEVAHHAAVVGAQGPLGVEDARDLDVHAVLAAVVEEQGFGAALAFVVAGSRADGLDLAPVAFELRMDPLRQHRPGW